MLNAYEQRLMAFYLANAASALHHRDREASDLADWIADRENRVAFGGRKRPSLMRAGKRGRDEGMSGGRWHALGEALREEYSATRKARPDRTGQRLRRLARTTGLSRTDVDLLELVLHYQTQPVIESMIDDVFRSSRRYTPLNVQNPALPSLLGISANTVQGRLRADSPLVRSGLVCIDTDGDLKALDRLNRLAAAAPAGSESETDVHRLLLDAAPASELDWSDFDHVAHDRDHVERVIKGALASGAPGVNILLYGPPGTGKTEFCKVLAERLGVSLYSVGESDDGGDEPVRGERLQELRLAQRLLAGHGGSLLLFDEMEDLLSDPYPAWGVFGPFSRMAQRNTGSKVFMHRLLEAAPTPTLWSMNSPRGVSETILRRMMFALELRRPTPRVRARIWERELARHGIEAPDEDVHALAREFEATPGVGAGATAAAGLAGGGIDTVRHGVRSLSRVLGCERPPQGPPPRFDLGLIQADTDPATLAECLVRRDAGRGFSLCLQGPPGTGKSAFARYLAERLGLEVLQKRTSDLLSPWVGETEQQIAAAFAEARDAQAFLIFDEADSLLGDRRNAHRSWEVSQVNEMLTWMESHPLPFACTTNFGEHLDPATLRRFVFKVRLDYLAPAQVEEAFRIYFALPPPPGLADLAALTPGDFAVVHRKAGFLGKHGEPETLALMLRAECEAKPDRPRPIGFRP